VKVVVVALLVISILLVLLVVVMEVVVQVLYSLKHLIEDKINFFLIFPKQRLNTVIIV